MVAGALAASGLWTGKTVGRSIENPKGFYENRLIRNEIVKKILSALGADPLGVDPLPNLDGMRKQPALRGGVERAIKAEGYAGDRPWGYKDPKLSLIWPMWRDAFPNAVWVIVRRNRDKVIRSCLATSFMARRSADPEFWSRYCDALEDRLGSLRAVQTTIEIDATDIAEGKFDGLETICQQAGLTLDQNVVRQFVDQTLFDRDRG